MTSIPYMPLYVGDYLGDTQHLTTEQHGAYLLLLMAMWRSGGRLPSDPKKLARIARVAPQRWAAMSVEVMEFFELNEDFITHNRLEQEIEKANQKSQKRSEAGRRGGNAKALKNKNQPLANALAKPCHSSISESESEEKDNTPIPPKGASPSECLTAFENWNDLALRCGLPQAAKLTPDRQRKIAARLKAYGLDGWQRALAHIEQSAFLTGQNDRGWRVNLEFVLQPTSFAKLHDGAYGNGRHAASDPAYTGKTIDKFAHIWEDRVAS